MRVSSVRRLLALVVAVLCIHTVFGKLHAAEIEAGFRYTPHYPREDFIPPRGLLSPKDAYKEYIDRAKELVKRDPLHSYMRYISKNYQFEVTDPMHRKDLEPYYYAWKRTDRKTPFYDWIAKDQPNLQEAPLLGLSQIQYFNEQERAPFEVVVKDGKLVYKQTGQLVDTPNYSTSALANPVAGNGWLFVFSADRRLFVARKQKGFLQHSSLGGYVPVLSAGLLSVSAGKLNGVSHASGHYTPLPENIDLLFAWLQRQGLETSAVTRVPVSSGEMANRILKWHNKMKMWKNKFNAKRKELQNKVKGYFCSDKEKGKRDCVLEKEDVEQNKS
ncbi:hypothetical protein HK102_003081 [Quaeritorhiza haematococci]|nr:hypothetical protein HK102_003081 [Quaeritorhiza haematococci]